MNKLFVYLDPKFISDMSFDEMMTFKSKYKLRTPSSIEFDYGKYYKPGRIAYIFDSDDDKLRLELILKCDVVYDYR